MFAISRHGRRSYTKYEYASTQSESQGLGFHSNYACACGVCVGACVLLHAGLCACVCLTVHRESKQYNHSKKEEVMFTRNAYYI